MSGTGQLEKRLAWQLLLPVRAGRRVHLQGFPDGAATLWQELRGEEVVQQGSEADVRLYWDPDPRDVQSGPEGFVVIGSKKSIPDAGANGNLYSLLPTSDPRLVLPLQHRKQLLRGLTMHRPGQKIAQLAVAGIKVAAYLGRVAPLERRVLWISGINVPEFGDNAVLYLGTADDDRKTTVLPAKGQSVLKFGFSKSAKTAISQEAKALEAMAETPLSRYVPNLISIRTGATANCLEQEYRRRRTLSTSRLRYNACQFLAGMAAIGAEQRPFSECAPLGEGRGELISLPRVWDGTVPGHRSHGDFAPWNMMGTKQGFFVFDWEHSISWAPAFSDAFQFIVAPAIHIRPKSDPRKITDNALKFATQVAAAAGIDSSDIPLCWALWLTEQKSKKHVPLLLQMLKPIKL